MNIEEVDALIAKYEKWMAPTGSSKLPTFKGMTLTMVSALDFITVLKELKATRLVAIHLKDKEYAGEASRSRIEEEVEALVKQALTTGQVVS